MIISFDTSNYTTSIAVLDADKIEVDYRRFIKVKQGERGIRQSDAFFQHIQNLNDFIANDFEKYRDEITVVGVSTRPRPVENSYMPVFTAGKTVATCLAKAMALPLVETSHQEGHLYSALYKQSMPADFLFFHISGGTTEIHKASEKNGLYHLELIAETGDINFGQLIDRIGVKTGLSFPAGALMDKARVELNEEIKSPKFKAQKKFNLSGYENHFTKLYENGLVKGQLYQLLFEIIAKIMVDLVAFASEQTGIKSVLIAGGVAENSLIKQKLRLASAYDIKFAASDLARDNAIGVARYTNAYLNNKACY